MQEAGVIVIESDGDDFSDDEEGIKKYWMYFPNKQTAMLTY
jgi:hypothetical protein